MEVILNEKKLKLLGFILLSDLKTTNDTPLVEIFLVLIFPNVAFLISYSIASFGSHTEKKMGLFSYGLGNPSLVNLSD